MRRLGVLLLAVATAGAAAATTSGAPPVGPSGRAQPPEGILVSVDSSRCYTGNARVKVTVTNLMAGSSVQASSEETVSASAKASPAGVAVIRLTAPSALPQHQHVEAHLLRVVGTDATGGEVGSDAAFVFGTKRVCDALNRP
jgi:hypothetical protein